MESPLKARARLARQKAKEGATAKRKRAQKGAQVPPLGARLEKRWTTSTGLDVLTGCSPGSSIQARSTRPTSMAVLVSSGS